jgi:adapter protein MecA 1/2
VITGFLRIEEDPAMKLERLSHDKIRIFLTFDDLTERGIQKDDIWGEIPKVHELFNDLMDRAYSELGFEASGPLAVEVFALPAQGMVVIVTKGKSSRSNDSYDSEEDNDVYEMEVTLEETDLISFTFNNIEEVISVARMIGERYTDLGTLYFYKGEWVLQIHWESEDQQQIENMISILSEFGEANSLTEAMLQEYGKLIIEHNAIGVIRTSFV